MKTKKYTIEHNNTDVRKLWNLAKNILKEDRNGKLERKV